MFHATKHKVFSRICRNPKNKKTKNAKLRGIGMISQGPFAKGWSLRISISDLSPKSTKPCLWDLFPWNHTQVQLIWNNYLYTPKHAMLMDLNCKIGRSYIECVGDEVSKHLWNSNYSVWEWELGWWNRQRTNAPKRKCCTLVIWWVSLSTSV